MGHIIKSAKLVQLYNTNNRVSVGLLMCILVTGFLLIWALGILLILLGLITEGILVASIFSTLLCCVFLIPIITSIMGSLKGSFRKGKFLCCYSCCSLTSCAIYAVFLIIAASLLVALFNVDPTKIEASGIAIGAIVFAFLFVVFLILCLGRGVAIVLAVCIGIRLKKGTLDASLRGVKPVDSGAEASSGSIPPVANPNPNGINIDTSKYELSMEDFVIIEKIGSGAFGNVFKADFKDTIVALKTLNIDAADPDDPDFKLAVVEFKKEVEILAQLRHPNILYFFGACLKPPSFAIATEFMEMGSLKDFIHKTAARKRLFDWPLKKKIMLDVSRGLKFLHDQNMIHRDLKPANVLLDAGFVAKVADFGLSKRETLNSFSQTKTAKGKLPRSASASGSGSGSGSGSNSANSNFGNSQMTSFVGSPLWMAPEVVRGEAYNSSCDVYSFGIVMWEVLTEGNPYDEQLKKIPASQIPYKVATDKDFRPILPDIESLLEGNQNLQYEAKSLNEYTELMQRCWTHEPSSRPTFTEVVQQLKQLVQ